jgi:biopolymer transport protein ExbD
VSPSRLLNEIRAARTGRQIQVLRADQGATIGQFATVASAARALDMRVLMATERTGRSR